MRVWKLKPNRHVRRRRQCVVCRIVARWEVLDQAAMDFSDGAFVAYVRGGGELYYYCNDHLPEQAAVQYALENL